MTPSKTSVPAEVCASKAYQYAADVVSGSIVSGKRRIQACRRFLDELERSEVDPDYPWAFDLQKAYRPIEFIERFLVPTKGAYDRMELLPWQHFVEANLYGWVSRKTGYRRFREGIVIVGQGNGKSTMIAGNAAYALTKDGERGAEVYCLANSREQARIIFNECSAQVTASPLLSKHIRVTKQGMFYDGTNSKFQPLASDSKNLDGRNVHMGVFDEIQEYRDYKLINVIKGKTKKRKQPLILYITTLGTVIDGPLMDYYILGGNILDSSGAIAQRAADRIFVYIDEIDEEDQPEDPACWGKANPSLGILLDKEDLLDEWERVKTIPAERSNFINKQLNVFTQVDELSFLDPKTILKNNRTIDLETLREARCYGGFDLAETEDFTSACLEFPLPDNDFFLLEHSWVPEKKRKEDREKLDWESLIAHGWLTIVPGEYVDYNLVFQWFMEQREKYRIDSIGYDRAKAFLLVQLMQKHGFVMNEVAQGELTLTAPLDHLKERFLDGNIIHNNNRLFSWYLGNVKLTKRGPNATYLPTKQNKHRKIDGFAALLDAHTEWLRKNPRLIPPDKKLTTVINLG
ncbi:MAG: terminase large subunit [Oscillospiraceae bacterium]|nr:terminase large subunit [Oscillospiraceae bacterium]